MPASASTLLNCGRLVVRAVVSSGLHTHTASMLEADDAPLHTRARQHQQQQPKGCSSQEGPPVHDNGGPSPSTSVPATSSDKPSKHARRFIAACCGFPKDMLFGPSFVRDHGVFGDDACFIARHKTADVVGIADGVGGWRQHGIDPSIFSRSLMRACSNLVDAGKFEPDKPALLLAAAYRQLYLNRMKSIERKEKFDRKTTLIGSSTACVVALERSTSRLYTANLGDSGFIVMRGGRIVYQSEEQTHYFNAPFQLALPPNISEGDGFIGDSPEMADMKSFDIEDGDIILLATDGLFDNLPTAFIERELAALQKGDLTEQRVQEACNSLALQARRLAFDERHMSPFALKAKEHGIHAPGGKPDDITLVLVVIAPVAV
uniref:Protein phosphatase n=1 Tax=Plectus sambesii TaxID=2011161 RepID=A0A914X569_9BILA